MSAWILLLSTSTTALPLMALPARPPATDRPAKMSVSLPLACTITLPRPAVSSPSLRFTLASRPTTFTLNAAPTLVFAPPAAATEAFSSQASLRAVTFTSNALAFRIIFPPRLVLALALSMTTLATPAPALPLFSAAATDRDAVPVSSRSLTSEEIVTPPELVMVLLELSVRDWAES